MSDGSEWRDGCAREGGGAAGVTRTHVRSTAKLDDVRLQWLRQVILPNNSCLPFGIGAKKKAAEIARSLWNLFAGGSAAVDGALLLQAKGRAAEAVNANKLGVASLWAGSARRKCIVAELASRCLTATSDNRGRLRSAANQGKRESREK